MPSHLYTPIFRFIGLSVVIFIGGWLGLKMAVPPGYASPLWPPAGLALAGLMLWGKPLWPAVWLASFANNLLAGYHVVGELNQAVLISSGLIATGSTLQALLACWLVEKWLTGPDQAESAPCLVKVATGHRCRLSSTVPRLDNPRQTVLFFLLSGPLACLVAATVGTGSIVALNMLAATMAPQAWLNWWIGDSLGVLIITPLVFCLFAEPCELWRARRLRVGLPLLVTILALIMVFTQVYRAEQARLQMAFDSEAQAIDRVLKQYAENAVDSSLALRDLFYASDRVSRHDFAIFAQSLLIRHPEIQALEWLPRVSRAELDHFEKTVQAEGFPQFRVTERAADGSLVAVTPRDEYFPINFVEPLQGNEQAFGYDSASSPASRQSKRIAQQNGLPNASERLRLVQRPEIETAVLISIPVFDKNAEGLHRELVGFVSVVILPSRMVETALQGLDIQSFAISLEDLSAPADATELYRKTVAGVLNPMFGLKSRQHGFDFAGRSWQITISTHNEFLVTHGSSLPWVTLIGGLSFASLLSLLLLVLSGRAAHVESLIEARTRELKAANLELKATEKSLRESENQLRTVLESQPECIKLLSRDGRLLKMNRAGLDIIEADSFSVVEGAEVLSLLLPSYQKAFADMIARVFDGESVTLEFEILTLKGTHRWLDTHSVPMRDSEGHITALLGLTRDVTERKRMETTLRESEQKLSNILNNIDAYVYLKDTAGRYLYANRLVCELWDTTQEQIIGYGDEKFFDPATAVKIRDNDRRVLEGGETLKVEETNLLRSNGQAATYLSTKLPLRNEQGAIYALVGISTDITERKQSEESLKLAARVFGEAHEGILITDAQGAIIDVNPTFCEITGYQREEVLGQNPRVLRSGKHGDDFYDEMWHALSQNRHWQGEVWNRKKSGELYAELLTVSALCDEQGQILYYVGLFSDITQSKQQQQMLELLAHYDPLTRLPNRTLFADRLLQAIAHSKREKSLLAIGFLDLDGFKPVNDQFGHDAGDQVLIEVAQRIKNSVREEDSVSRHGGDEFTLLLGGLHSLEQCQQAVARIHQAIAEPYFINGQAVSIGASSGLTVYPLDDADADTLLRHADHAMYQAKLAGKNRYCLFDVSLDQQLIDRHQQARDIEIGWLDQQFCLYYQPKVNLKTGQVTGVEALIRWIHPQRGMIPPLAFLPVIASSELEIQIGHWVIGEAWQQLAAWHELGLKLEVSINISAYHLLSENFFADLEATLAGHPHVASHYLQLEILESTALDDIAAVNRVIKRCRDELGVTSALDDFGTGYSSLAHLRHLPIDTVKIDQGFVRDMLDDADDYAIVESVIGLSHAFRREVVAEGVESLEQGSVLLLMGCHLAQGYAIAKPMPAAEIADWANHYQPFPEWTQYADGEFSAEQTLIAIRRIDIQQWLHRVENCLTSKQNGLSTWPVMDSSKTQLGRWLKQVQQRHQYNEQWVDECVRLQEELLRQGQVMMHQFWAGEADVARASLAELQTVQQQLLQWLAAFA